MSEEWSIWKAHRKDRADWQLCNRAFISVDDAERLLADLVSNGLSGDEIFDAVRFKGIWLPPRGSFVEYGVHFDARPVANTTGGIGKLRTRVSRDMERCDDWR